MGLARVTVFFCVIFSLFLLSPARCVLDDFFSAAVTVQDPPEDTDRKAIAVPLEKPSSSDESIPAVEGLHRAVDLSLLRPIDHHVLRPIDRQYLPRESPHGRGWIRFPWRLPGEMRWIPTRRTPEADDAFGKLVEAMPQDLTEVDAEEAKEWIPVEWKAKDEQEEEEHKRKKKKRGHKKKKDGEEDEESDSDSDDEEEVKEIKKKKKRAKHEEREREEGGLMKRFWAFLNRL